ncbi:MAG: hypothetical protein WCL70_09210 [Paludibacter sp.]
MRSVFIFLLLILLPAISFSQSDSLSQNPDILNKQDSLHTNLSTQTSIKSNPTEQKELIYKSLTQSDSLNKHIDYSITSKKIKKGNLEWIKVIGLYTAAVVLNGIGDGLNDSHEKTWGHVYNAASIGLLVASPFLINYDTKKWYWYLASYTSLRIGLFDVCYNLTRGLPIDYTGITSSTDIAYNILKINPMYVRSVFFAIGFTIPITALK